MKLKYYLRGIGIGVILTAIVMGFALGGRKTTMSDAEVIERAKELGMTDGGVLSDTVNEGDAVEESNTSSSDQALDEAGKEISKEIDEAFASASESASFLASKEEEGKTQEAKEENKVTEASIEASKELSTEKPETKVEDKKEETKEEVAESESTEQLQEVAKTEEKPAETTDNDQTSVSGTAKTVTIPGGKSSDAVAQILYEAGVIDNAVSFNRYLIDKGLDRIIRSGTRTFPAGSTYEDVAYIITH
ncbi:hypothetical protein SAMN02910275_01839 [Butyrivibrio sp. INlla18]|uniref:hypothetical protein n=1 Tax=Butyrivibrio sp. INlla18 TaxID=1520806 RepID=UPI000880DA11|nr:hypothetical protein [Butyrivibrio sp. INlla18]SDA64400.1 hypothetical protein SAMN02910275_01839 [Butyrivibrio sp. INlla18]